MQWSKTVSLHLPRKDHRQLKSRIIATWYQSCKMITSCKSHKTLPFHLKSSTKTRSQTPTCLLPTLPLLAITRKIWISNRPNYISRRNIARDLTLRLGKKLHNATQSHWESNKAHRRHLLLLYFCQQNQTQIENRPVTRNTSSIFTLQFLNNKIPLKL